MSKAAEAFRTISEVADELDVQKHVLRFWEARFPQVRPMKRGGGRRYYRPEDMELLRGIRHLLHAEGYTIKGVQKILREQGIDHVKQHGRLPGEAETRAPAAGRGIPDARAMQANVPATGGRGRGPVPVSARRAAARNQGNAIEHLAAIEAAIKELEQCRSILLETLGKNEPLRAPRRARAVGA
ncbi:MAG: MerR family transcriptional regulator [Hyphomicrobium zavarzinii]|jgi:DNA-binding transcriptional MerR regulator|uniref:MerR family transcriptional regulator n=1 Tax=Hyphomicrobium TaxID=81 RepID=UPI001A4409FF|nr:MULTISPECIES: MerR family transcriptional regulator [Hyphomicrobium]MBL8846822.1 MerR family transcriptional regulator [Hyphomicrobium zavarzinii]WBT38085.1 MerR family transcriptional regulator [Hyphomicrobium sp. DMF-1]